MVFFLKNTRRSKRVVFKINFPEHQSLTARDAEEREREKSERRVLRMAEGDGDDAKDENQSLINARLERQREQQQQQKPSFSPTRSTTTRDGKRTRRRKTRDASALPSARLYQSFSDWKYIATFASVALVMVTVFFIYLSLAAWTRCTRNITSELQKEKGREELVKTWLTCTYAREVGNAYKPWKWDDFAVLFVRLCMLSQFGEVVFHQMVGWHVSRFRNWRTKTCVYSFGLYNLTYFGTIAILGFYHQYTQYACYYLFGILMWSGLSAFDFWSTKGISYGFVYIYLMAIIGKNVVEFFLIVMSDQSVSPMMKLFIRFGLDPIFWELVRGAERHFARLNPSPGPCLQIPYYLSFALQQAFFSRYVMFLLAADGTVKSMATVQTILSLHELMIALTTKDRDKYLARAFLGKQTAEALLTTQKQHDILAMNSIISAFAEIAAIIVISIYLYIFRMAKVGNESIVSFKSYAIQAVNLIAIEIALSFLTVYVQQRFHGMRHKSMFPKIKKKKKNNDNNNNRRSIKEGNIKKQQRWFGGVRRFLEQPPYAFYVFIWVGVMLIHKITTYLVGGQFHRYLCPRVDERDGSIYTFQCTTEDLDLAPGGFYFNMRGFMIQMIDFPVANNEEQFYRNTSQSWAYNKNRG